MTTLTEKFEALEAQINDDADEAHSQRATIETTLEDIQTTLANINSDMLLMKSALIQAVGQSGACFPCPTPSIVVPTVPTTTEPVNPERCQRSQAFIATMHNILAAFDTLQSFNVVGTFNVLNDAISEVIAAVAAGDTVPLPSFPETVQIVGTYISYAGERLFSGVALLDQFTPLETALRQATYSSTNAEAAQSAYRGVIDASGASSGAKFLFDAIAYNAIAAYFFDPTTSPDLSGYSGATCVIAGGCVAIATVVTALNGSGAFDIVDMPTSIGGQNHNPGNTSNHNSWATLNFDGWTLTMNGTGNFFRNEIEGPNGFTTGVPVVIHNTVPPTPFYLAIVSTSGPLTGTLCPP